MRVDSKQRLRHNRRNKKPQGNAHDDKIEVARVELLSCDAGWRNYHFVKVTTEDGVIGWSEYDEGFGSPASARRSSGFRADHRTKRLSARAHLRGAVRGNPARRRRRVAQALGAIENALLDAKAKLLGVPCYELLGGKIRDRVSRLLVALRDVAHQSPKLV